MELAKLFESVSDGKRVPVMALTATATSLVRREIVTRLGLGRNGGPMHTLINRRDLKIHQSLAVGNNNGISWHKGIQTIFVIVSAPHVIAAQKPGLTYNPES
jgi:superfamily II DNA helicase RecQ